MSTRKRPVRASRSRSAFGAGAAHRRNAGPRQADHRGRHRGLGHRRAAGRHRLAARQRHGRAGRADLRAEMRHVPRRERGQSARPATRRWSARRKFDRIDTPKTIAYYGHATTLFDFIRRAMPCQMPRTLTDDEVYALTAYILALNKIIGENDVMNARDPAEGEDAEPRQLHHPVPGQDLNVPFEPSAC